MIPLLNIHHFINPFASLYYLLLSQTDSVDGSPIVIDHPIAAVEATIPEETPQAEETVETSPKPIVKIENAIELAANSNLKVDVEEFHPRIPNYPTPAQAAHASHQRQYRNHNNAPTQYYNNTHNSNNSNNYEQYPRRRPDEEFRRRRFQDSHNAYNNTRPPRRTFNNNAAPVNSKPAAVDEQKPQTEEKKTIEAIPVQAEKPTNAQVTNAQKTSNKSANKPNSKRAIQASIKHIEEQNIDLSKTKIAATSSSSAASDSNQWLVKTKGKKTKVVMPSDIPEDDMFENEDEIYSETTNNYQLAAEDKPEPVIRASTPVPEVEQEPEEEEVVEEPVEQIVAKAPKSPSNKQKKSPNTKPTSPAAKPKGKNKSKSKTSVGKGATGTGSKGFEVIEPDFGVITRLKTEPISLDPELQEELENILNMKDIDEQELNKSMPIEEDPIFRSSSLPKSPRSERDNVIDLDDLEALERSLMDFDLSGELKERMIEIIQSEMDAPLGGDGNEEQEVAEEIELVPEVPNTTEVIEEMVEEEEVKEVTIVEEVLEIIPEPKESETEECSEPVVIKEDVCVVEEVQEKVMLKEERVLVVNEVNITVEEADQEEEHVEVVVDAPKFETLFVEVEVAKEEEIEQEDEKTLANEDTVSAEDHSEQTELKIITHGMSMDENCTGSSSSSSSLSSPIPTDDGRDGSNSESDDAMTPPAIHADDQEKKMVLPSQLEGRLFPREQIKEETPEQVAAQTEPVESSGIAASVSKWLEEKAKDSCSEPIFRIPSDPQVAKLIFKAMYGVDLALDGEEDEDGEFETEDDMDSLSADESDFEPYSRDSLKDLLGRGISGEKRDNQVPIDTDSDYMSDGQNIKPADMGKMPNGHNNNNKTVESAELKAGGGRRGDAKMCKVM